MGRCRRRRLILHAQVRLVLAPVLGQVPLQVRVVALVAVRLLPHEV
jgi:hypothetical protein